MSTQRTIQINPGQIDAASACSFSGTSQEVKFTSNSVKPVNGDILYADHPNTVLDGGEKFFKEIGVNGTETFKVSINGVVSEVAPCVIPDITAPVITITGDNPATVELGTTYTDAGATADGGETVTTTGTVDTSTVGAYTITYSATDAAR